MARSSAVVAIRLRQLAREMVELNVQGQAPLAQLYNIQTTLTALRLADKSLCGRKCLCQLHLCDTTRLPSAAKHLKKNGVLPCVNRLVHEAKKKKQPIA